MNRIDPKFRLTLLLLLLPGCATEGPVLVARPDGIPLASVADAIIEGAEDLGGSLVAVGDLDGDGIDDLAISRGMYLAPGDGPIETCWSDDAGPHCVGHNPWRGAVHILYGGSMPSGNVDFAPDATLEMDERGAMGSTLSRAGDLDGDGFDDLVISAGSLESCHLEVPVEPRHGSTYVVYGGPGRLAGTMRIGALASRLTDPVECGATVTAAAGDLDGDGRGDLAIMRNDPMDGLGGITTLIYGRADRFGGAASIGDGDAHLHHAGDALNQLPVAIGDFDGDGRDDLMVTEHTIADNELVASAARMVWGSPERLGGNLASATLPALLVTREQSVAFRLDDLDGDGADDLGVWDWDGNMVVIYGGARLVDASLAVVGAARLGTALTLDPISDDFDDGRIRVMWPTSGDLDGDGARELAIAIGTGNGGVWVLDGDGARFSGDIDLDVATEPYVGVDRPWRCEGSETGATDCPVVEFAGSTLVISDLDGDGDGEMLVGAPTNWSGGGPSGRIYVLE